MFNWHEDSDSFDFALQMDQGPLLDLLLKEAKQRDCFTYLNGTTVNDLLRQDGSINGIEATERPSGDRLHVQSRLVVGADGRYSTVRDRADIDDGRSNSELELLWFKLSSSPTDLETHLRIANEGVLVYAPLNENEGQYGLFIEGGTYPEVRDRGIDHLRERVSTIEPDLEEAVWNDLDSFDDCALLDIEPGIAPVWRQDGLLPVGDAAHIASPFGEGNVLAMHDAAKAHPDIVEALRQNDGVLPKERFATFEQTRREAVQKSMDSSAHMQRLMSFVTGEPTLPQLVQRTVVRNLFRTMGFVSTVTDHVPHSINGDQYVPIRTSLFAE